MARYVSLSNWTDEGIRNYKDTMERADAIAALAKRLGGELVDVYWTVGPYDSVAILDFPDDEAGTAAALKVGSMGSIRTTTMRAFNRAEMSRIIAKAG